ncbi:50S ribosomal protein L31 [Candidatus Beckwithbacteria bacterium]|nr:50S ribosomal protein L31 [Candidatus Beckwithbacteria bacterium]
MKAKIHPNYKHDVTVTCACGNTFLTGSTMDKITVDICSLCHPFYTGEMKFVDTQGRVEKFQAKMAQTKGQKYVSKKKRKQAELSENQEDLSPKSLKEMIQQQRKSSKKSVSSSQ